MPTGMISEMPYLFIGSTHIGDEALESSEMAREWRRRQAEEAAARQPRAERQVDPAWAPAGQFVQ